MYIHSVTNETPNDLVVFNKDNLNYEIFKNEIIKQKNIPTNEKGDYSIEKLTLQLLVVDVDTFELTKDNFNGVKDMYLNNFNYHNRQALDLYCNVGWKPVKPQVVTCEVLEGNNKNPAQLKVYLNINKKIYQKYIAKIITEMKQEELYDVFPTDQFGIDPNVLVNINKFVNENKIHFQIGCGNEISDEPEWSDQKAVDLQLNANIDKKDNGRSLDQDLDTTHLVLIAPPCRGDKRYYYKAVYNSRKDGFVPFKTLSSKYGVYYCQHKEE